MVVDTETTGLQRDADRLIEITSVKVVRGTVVDRFQTLINPMREIPWRISRLTGIRTDMVAHAPAAGEALPAFVKFAGDAVVVFHNESFDKSFINAELQRAELEKLANSTICTLRLARRLLRGLHSKSLASLKEHFGVEVSGAHRALADAQATSEVLLHLLALLQTKHNLHTVGELERFQRRTYRKTGPTPRNVQELRESVLPKVPHTPGVYFMYGRDKRLLYIGKARDLSQRVRSYFVGTEGKDGWTRKLMRSVHVLTWEETQTELEAMLLELRLRKMHQPSFNRADRQVRNRRYFAPPFLRIGSGRLTVVRHVRDDAAEYYGPFPNDQQAETIVKAFFRVYGMRDGSAQENQYSSLRAAHLGGILSDRGLDEVRTFLREPREEILLRVHALMEAAAQAQAFERAAEYRGWIGTLTGFSRKHYVTGESVFDRNAVVVLLRDATAEVHVVRYGLPVEAMVLTRPVQTSGMEVIHICLAQHFSSNVPRPQRYSFQQSDEIRILAWWLHQEQKRTVVIPWSPDADQDTFTDSVTEAVTAGGVRDAEASGVCQP